jgi:hypothetical protein
MLDIFDAGSGSPNSFDIFVKDLERSAFFNRLLNVCSRRT